MYLSMFFGLLAIISFLFFAPNPIILEHGQIIFLIISLLLSICAFLLHLKARKVKDNMDIVLKYIISISSISLFFVHSVSLICFYLLEGFFNDGFYVLLLLTSSASMLLSLYIFADIRKFSPSN